MRLAATIRKEGAPEETRVIEAASRFEVYDQVQKEGGIVIRLVDADAGFVLPSWLFITIGTGVKRIEIIHLARNLSTMLGAGLSLSRAFSVIERQSSNKRLKEISLGITESIKKGTSLNESLVAYPRVFSPLFIAMAKAGEESGSLSEALSVIALQMEQSEELARKIRGAMIYPIIVLTAIIIVGVLMLIYVVPTLTSTFTSLGVELPLVTRIIVAVSNFLVGNLILFLLALAALVVGSVVFLRSEIGKALLLRSSLHLPVINELVRETFTARAARTLSSLLAAGVPVLEALSITKDVVHAPIFARVIDEAVTHVRKGEPLSQAFNEHPELYPILMADMLSVGEETGKVADMLKQIAEFYEQDVSEKTKDLSTIIEPVLMLVIGVVVGVFAVSMIGPIYSLSSAF